MAFSVGTLRHEKLRDIHTPHWLDELEAAVCSQGEADTKVTAHAGYPSAHHAKTQLSVFTNLHGIDENAQLDCGEARITGSGTIKTSLALVFFAVVCAYDSAGTIPTVTASITSVSGGDISVVVTRHAAAANSVETSEKRVSYIALGVMP